MKKILIAVIAIFIVNANYAKTLNIDWSKGMFIDKNAVIAELDKITKEKYPNADAVLVDDYEKIYYHEDGTSEKFDEVYEKILTEKGKRENKSITLHYSYPYSTVKLLLLEIVGSDGKTTPVDIAKYSKEMIDPSQMQSNIYNPNNKVIKISIPNLEIGDTIHSISYRKTVKARMKNSYSDYFVLEYTNPIKHYVVDITGPKDFPLQNIKLRDEIKGKVKYSKKIEKETINYKWEVKDIPRIFKEPSMPAYHTVVQRLLVSTNPDWEFVSKWYWDLSEPHFETSPEMVAKVAELIKGITDRQMKIEAIFQFVSQEIRYMGITIEKEAPGYEPHDAIMTFEKRHGVCRDKAALLVAMLRIAKFAAYPVLIHNGEKKDMEVPAPFFNHAITAVENSDGTYILMDSTDENTKDIFPAYLCDKSYLVAKPAGEGLKISRIRPATENLVKISTKGELKENGDFSAETKILFDGVNDGAYRGFFLRSKKERRKQLFESRLKSIIPGAKLTSITVLPENLSDMTIPLSVNLKYQASQTLIDGDKINMLTLPWLGTSFGMVNFVLDSTALETRKYPFVTGIACGVKEDVEIKTKFEDVKFVSPNYSKISDEKLLWNRNLKFDNSVIKGSNEFYIKGVEFSTKEYLILKEALKKIEYNNRKKAFMIK